MADVADESGVIDEEERRAGLAPERGAHVGVLQVIAVLLAIFGMPALIRPGGGGTANFDSGLLAAYRAARPEFVFIGNSMLRTRIDERVLGAKLGGRCCFVLWTGGAESAWTHQALKNIVLAGTHRPKRVFIFFRDAYLTQPTYRATDQYWWKIERLSHADEPELQRAMRLSRSWQESLEHDLAVVYPVQRARERASAALSWAASELATPGRVPFGAAAGEKYDGLFDLQKLRATEADDTASAADDPSEFDFDAHVENSLLPSMIRMARRAGVGLVFVRVQRRPSAHGPPPQRPELRAYVDRLRAYVERSGESFYDFTGDPELVLDHYMDGDHIRADWRAQSTENFMRRLGPALR